MLWLLLATAFASDYLLKQQFFDFKKTYAKNYTNYEEHLARFEVFKQNLKKIEEHNAKKLSWTMGITEFADMTPFEFTAYVKRGNGGGYIPRPESERNVDSFPLKGSKASCTEVDWVSKGAVTPVKNQGQCGSCWSFSTTGAIEGRSQIATGTLASLSEQELVDCDTTDNACNGGLMDYGFEYVQSNNGLCAEASYSYEAKKGSCRRSSCGTRFDPISNHQDVPTKDQDALESALCEGPVSIAIEADQQSFQMYTGGVLTSTCGANLDHGVLLVGMGTDPTYGDYWKVKNSWGANWGEQGYIRLCRNCNKNCGWLSGKCKGQCGLMGQPSYPVV